MKTIGLERCDYNISFIQFNCFCNSVTTLQYVQFSIIKLISWVTIKTNILKPLNVYRNPNIYDPKFVGTTTIVTSEIKSPAGTRTIPRLA